MRFTVNVGDGEIVLEGEAVDMHSLLAGTDYQQLLVRALRRSLKEQLARCELRGEGDILLAVVELSAAELRHR